MRTTLNIDDDVLAIARERARREHKSVGEFVSETVRAALTASPDAAPLGKRNGFPQLPRRGGIVTNEMIDKLRDDLGI